MSTPNIKYEPARSVVWELLELARQFHQSKTLIATSVVCKRLNNLCSTIEQRTSLENYIAGWLNDDEPLTYEVVDRVKEILSDGTL